MAINRLIRDTIYALKREYGYSGSLYVETFSTNLSTGAKVRTATPYVIKKVIILPSNWQRKFAYDLSFVAANKNFTYGGFFDADTRNFIVDCADLPKNFEITLDHVLIIGTKRYVLSSVQLVDDQGIWLLSGKSLRGELPGQVISIAVQDDVTSTEDTDVSTE